MFVAVLVVLALGVAVAVVLVVVVVRVVDVVGVVMLVHFGGLFFVVVLALRCSVLGPNEGKKHLH